MTSPSVVDTDKDGLSDTDETNVYGTSPILADTDGDGMDDYTEVVLHGFDPDNAPLRFNPRVADVPVMNLRIVGAPLLTVRLTEANGQTTTFEVTQTEEVIFSETASETNSMSAEGTGGFSVTNTEELTVESNIDPTILIESEVVDEDEGGAVPPIEDVEDEDDDDDDAAATAPAGPVRVLITDAVSGTFSETSTFGVTLSLTYEQSRQIRRALTLAQAYSENHEIVASGGFLQILVEIENQGELPFQVTNLNFSAALIDGGGIEIPVGNLDIDTTFNNFQPYSLGPGEIAGPVNFSRDFLTLDQMASILADIRALVIRLGVYELTDDEDKPYAFDTLPMRSRTATVNIDYGAQRPMERYMVATNIDPAFPGVSIERALGDILRIGFNATPEGGLTAIRGIGVNESTDAAVSKNGYWDVQLRRDNGIDPKLFKLTAPYDLSAIKLHGGDVLRLRWVESKGP